MNFVLFSQDTVMNIGVVFFLILFIFLFFMALTIVISLFKKERCYIFTPSVTVIIPCYNEEKNIESCLESVLASNYPKDKYEIIVVDDGSTDSSRDIVRRFSSEHKHPSITLITQKHGGKAAGLNLAVSKSTKEIIVTIDADTSLDRNCLVELVAPMKRKEVGAVNGVSIVRRPKTLIERFQQVEYYYNNLVRVGFTRVFDSGIWFFSATASYRRALFTGKAFFSDTLTEDMDIALRISEKGYKVLTSSRALCYTKAPDSLVSLFQQRMRWWFGVLLALIKNRKVLNKHASLSIWFLYVNQFWWSFYSLFSLPLFIYQINYWLPAGSAFDVFMYFFRWFSLLGPFYVLYKIPEWGLSLLNIFGVMSGIISAAMIFVSFALFRKKINCWDILIVFFYFPYTIILNLIIFFSLVKYGLSRRTKGAKELRFVD